MGKITDLLRTSQFQAGLVDGVIALAVVLVCAAVRILGRRPAVGGAAFVGAGLAVLTGVGPGHGALDAVGLGAVAGVLMLVAGGTVSRVIPGPLRTPALPVLLVPGSVVLALAAWYHDAAGWAVLVLAAGLPLAGMAAADFDSHHARRAYGPALWAVTALGVYLTVPDTEGARALLGVALPLVFLTVPLPIASLGAGGAAASVGLLWFDVVIEGAERPGSIVGALGCLGLFLLEPIGRRVLVRMRERDGHGPFDHMRNVTVAVVLQLAVVLWASRVAGREDDALVALALLAPAIAAGIIVTPWLPDPPLPQGATHASR